MTTTNHQSNHESLLRWPEVAKRVPLSRSHAHAMAARGLFPKPIKIGPRASGWLESEIDDYVASLIAERGRIETAASPVGKKNWGNRGSSS